MGRLIQNLKKNNENVFSTDSVGSFCVFLLAYLIITTLVAYFSKESLSGIDFLES